jgi:hypothetical protein
VHFPKANRYTLGSKIDEIFLHAIEYGFLASYSNKIEKLPLIDQCIARVDLLKLVLQLAWEARCLDNNKFGDLGERLAEVGKMLGGWRRQTVQKLQAVTPGEKRP